MVTKPYFSETKAQAALKRALDSDWNDAEEFGAILLDFSYHAVDWIRPHHGDRDDHAQHLCCIALRYLKNGGYHQSRGTLFNYLTKIASSKAFTLSAKEGSRSSRETELPERLETNDAPHSDTIEVLYRHAPKVLIDALIESNNIRSLPARTHLPRTTITWHLAQLQRVLRDQPLLTPIEAHISEGVQQWLEL